MHSCPSLMRCWLIWVTATILFWVCWTTFTIILAAQANYRLKRPTSWRLWTAHKPYRSILGEKSLCFKSPKQQAEHHSLRFPQHRNQTKIKTKSLDRLTPFLKAQLQNLRTGKSLLICLSLRMARVNSETWQLSLSLPRVLMETFSSTQSTTSTNMAWNSPTNFTWT